MQHCAKKGITCTGGFDGIHPERLSLCLNVSGVGTASILPHRKKNQFNGRIALPNPGYALIVIFQPGQPLDFIVRDFQDVAMG